MEYLKHRGPDGFSEYKINIGHKWSATFAGSVLWMQGSELTMQPLVDDKYNILLWNGDAFSGLVVRKQVSVVYVMYQIVTDRQRKAMIVFLSDSDCSLADRNVMIKSLKVVDAVTFPVLTLKLNLASLHKTCLKRKMHLL
jgi:hypothetical protein